MEPGRPASNLGWFPATSLRFICRPTGAPWAGTGEAWGMGVGGFGPFRPRTALGTWRNPGPGPKTIKHNFPGLGALLGGKSGRPQSFSLKVRNFLTFHILADRTPTGGKRPNTGLGHPLAPRETLACGLFHVSTKRGMPHVGGVITGSNYPRRALGGAQSNRGAEMEKNVTTPSGMVLGRQTISFGIRKACVSAAELLRAPEWPCLGQAPGGAPSGPKMAQNHQKRALEPLWGPPEGSVVQGDGQNQLGYCLGCHLAVVGPMWPRNGVRWAENGFIWAPNGSCRLKLKNSRISG